MGLFSGFGKKKGMILDAPLKGECVSIKEVSDPTFSEEILGKGVAIRPVDGKVCAPADGEITTMFPTGHAVGMTTEDGMEVLIHVGIDTVSLKGEGFHIVAKEGDHVKKGDLLMEADLERIKEAGFDTITPVIICNSDEYKDIEGINLAMVEVGDPILSISK